MGRTVKTIVQTSQFKQDLKRLKYAGRYDIEDLLTVIGLLARNLLCSVWSLTRKTALAASQS